VLCGSSFKNKGVQPLLDAVIDYLPSPVDVPPVTGTELIKEIRGNWPDMPIILATGYGELPPGTTVDFKLTKPFGQEELSHAMSIALAK